MIKVGRLIVGACAAAMLVAPAQSTAMDGGSPQNPGPTWAARLDLTDRARCSASRISRYWVITAAHCLVRKSDSAVLSAGEMVLTFQSAGVRSNPVAVYPHPSFNINSLKAYGYDVGLLKLSPEAARAAGGPYLPLASSMDKTNLKGQGVTLFASGAVGGAFPAVPYKSPDHAWGLHPKVTPASKTGLRMLIFEQRNQASVVTGGDSGGAWVGWQRGGWRLLSVVNGWYQGVPGRQIGANLRNRALFTWIASTIKNG